MKKSSIFFLIIVACLVFYSFDRFGEIYSNSAETDMVAKLTEVSEKVDLLYEEPHISFAQNDLICGAVGTFCFALIVIYNVFNKKNYMQGVEHGSAKWATIADMAKFKDKKFDFLMLNK